MVKLEETFDYILVTVHYDQVQSALTELKGNKSSTIVTMVNNANGYKKWRDTVGPGRLLPAFPGAGGKIENDILYYQLTPKFVQPTTFGELDGALSDRAILLSHLFKRSNVPHSISKNMDAWQKSHLAMVTALASGIYFDGGTTYTTSRNRRAIRHMSLLLKSNFNSLKRIGIPIMPKRLNIFRLLPLWVLDTTLTLLYRTKFAESLINNNAQAARNEMLLLEKEFQRLIGSQSISKNRHLSCHWIICYNKRTY